MPAPVAKITEAKIEKKVVEFCRKNGLLTFKFASPSNRGVPDRIIVHKGKVMFLELKRPGNTPTALQEREIERLKAAGAFATWADSYDRAVSLLVAFFLIAEKKKLNPKDLI